MRSLIAPSNEAENIASAPIALAIRGSDACCRAGLTDVDSTRNSTNKSTSYSHTSRSIQLFTTSIPSS